MLNITMMQQNLCNFTGELNVTSTTLIPEYHPVSIDSEAKTVFLKIRIYAFVGLAFSVFGVVAGIIYKAGKSKNFYFGASACASLVIAGLIYWTAVVRFIHTLYQLQYYCDIKLWNLSQVSIPHTLIGGFLVGALNFFTAGLLFVVLSRNRHNKNNKYQWLNTESYLEEPPSI